MIRGENDEVTMDNTSISDTISKYYVNARKKLKVMPTKIVRKEKHWKSENKHLWRNCEFLVSSEWQLKIWSKKLKDQKVALVNSEYLHI